LPKFAFVSRTDVVLPNDRLHKTIYTLTDVRPPSGGVAIRAWRRISNEIPGVAAILAWEETSDHTIRLILTQEVRNAIIARAKATRDAVVASEDAAHRLISRVRVKPAPARASARDNRPDGDKLADALRLHGSFTDSIAATVMVTTLAQLADEFGIDLPAGD